MFRYMLLEFFDRHPVDPWTPAVSHHGPERLDSVFPFDGLFHQLLVHRFLSVVTRRLSLGMPSVRLRWLHHRAFLRRVDSDRSYRVLILFALIHMPRRIARERVLERVPTIEKSRF